MRVYGTCVTGAGLREPTGCKEELLWDRTDALEPRVSRLQVSMKRDFHTAAMTLFTYRATSGKKYASLNPKKKKVA